MATLKSLKQALRQSAEQVAHASPTRPLSDSEYDVGFNTVVQGLGGSAYQNFIVPQLSQILEPLIVSETMLSILEIGPGPESVLGRLPDYQRCKIGRYAAFEPNELYAEKLRQTLRSTRDEASQLPCLEVAAQIHHIAFELGSTLSTDTNDNPENFDIVVFCHSMYGMKPKRKFIEKALGLLAGKRGDERVVVVHREALDVEGLRSRQTASSPTTIRLSDNDETLDKFAPFIAGYVYEAEILRNALQPVWRKACRELGRRGWNNAQQLLFRSHDITMSFAQEATASPDLLTQLPMERSTILVKNREARLHGAASIMKPKDIKEVQQCARWALSHRTSLTVIGGGHSSHCLWPNTMAIDMGAFDQIHIVDSELRDTNTVVIAGAGCKSGDIISKTMAKGLTVALGSRPSVGAGLLLQGGIGHLARQYGLACDAVVGAVVVSVATGDVLCIGHVPSQHQPPSVLHSEWGSEQDLLWGLKGAGTNFGIVISVALKAYPAPKYSIQNWIIPLCSNDEARLTLQALDTHVVKMLPRHQSADFYLWYDADKLHLGVSMYESFTHALLSSPCPIEAILGPAASSQVVDSVELFDTELYMSQMHGGHAGGKTSSFKRCVFLKNIGSCELADKLRIAVESRPPPAHRCYLHLLHGGGAVGDVASSATAFGCRDWEFACVVTAVWARDEEDTESAHAATQWVYDVVRDLLPLSSGIYGADLGPDPRDVALATKAFGPNGRRLARLKQRCDPHKVLAYTCPLPEATPHQKLIVIVTGNSCSGKDYCAAVWTSSFAKENLNAHTVSISDSTKQEYASSSGADLTRLLEDRRYKEQHRPALTAYYKAQLQLRPSLPGEHFLDVVHRAGDVVVLFITGMRDEAPIATFGHLVPGCRLIEVNVHASGKLRSQRGGQVIESQAVREQEAGNTPTFIFNNDRAGETNAESFARDTLLPFFHKDLHQLNELVRSVPDFPCPGTNFRDVVGIVQQQGGLNLCTSLLRSHLTHDWNRFNAIVCCETGGFLFASALAALVNLPLVTVREAGKLPPPTVSVVKSASYISSSSAAEPTQKAVEMGRDAVPKGASVVVVDDVLATGATLCAVLELLRKAGIAATDTSVGAVAEFPLHRGREFLRSRGFGGVKIQSLLVLNGR